jgi:hypothetical protein
VEKLSERRAARRRKDKTWNDRPAFKLGTKGRARECARRLRQIKAGTLRGPERFLPRTTLEAAGALPPRT